MFTVPNCSAKWSYIRRPAYLRSREYAGEAVETEDRLTIPMPRELFTNANIGTLQQIVTARAFLEDSFAAVVSSHLIYTCFSEKQK